MLSAIGGGIVGAVLLERMRREPAKAPPATDKATTERTPPGRIAFPMKNECTRTQPSDVVDMPRRISLHALFDIDYTKSVLGPFRERHVYDFSCDLDEKTCNGATLSLRHIDKGEPLGTFDLGPTIDANVVSVAGDVITIKWGPLRQFVVDFGSKEVTYTESNDTTYGRAVSRCE